MIEREAAIKIYNEALGLKGNQGRLVRVAEHGFYEVILPIQGKQYTCLLPIAATVILAVEAEDEVASISVER
jgi:hypothetical protein